MILYFCIYSYTQQVPYYAKLFPGERQRIKAVEAKVAKVLLARLIPKIFDRIQPGRIVRQGNSRILAAISGRIP